MTDFPSRVSHLNSIENISQGWESLKLAIRPECREDLIIEKAKTAINAGLNDAAINYFWLLVINDLEKKIVSYGINYFSDAVSWQGKSLRSSDDLREVKDYELINGALSLGILASESHFFLQQCREIRNKFSTAHYPLGDIDKIETINFIKNCVKYVLTFDPPAPGLQIKDLIERLSTEPLDSFDDLKIIIESQSSKIHGPILHSLFSNFLKSDCATNLKHNITIIAPYLWDLVNEETKSAVAGKFGSLKEIRDNNTASEALAFLKIVKGVEYIPEGYKDSIFNKHSKYLIDAHMSWDNFYTEVGFSKELASLGSEIPNSSLPHYVKAVTLSFIGNSYGISSGSQEYNKKMVGYFNPMAIKTFLIILQNDTDVVWELMHPKQVFRLKEMFELLRDKTVFPKQKDEFDFYLKNGYEGLLPWFTKKYENIMNTGVKNITE